MRLSNIYSHITTLKARNIQGLLRKILSDVAKIKELTSEGLIKTEIAKRLGVGRATVCGALSV